MGLTRAWGKTGGNVGTIAELRTIEGRPGTTLQPLGYYVESDGGGGPVRVWKFGETPGTCGVTK